MFDAFLHAGALGAREVADLRFFGIEGALVPSGDAVVTATPAAIRRGWDQVSTAARRLRRGGLAAWAALGIHPRRIPARGLEALLAELPDALGRPEVAALGAVGLAEGGAMEERVLARQLELARELRLPVVAAVPLRGRERLTRRLLAALRESELEPARVLVAGADERTVKAIRACGHLAGLALSGGAGPRGAVDAAVRVVASLGPEGIVLGSDAGVGAGDLLALARAADRMAKAGLAPAVIRRVCGANAIRFLGVDPAGLRGRGSSARSARPSSR
ncbi:TatD-related deoxyribonuclease [Anaeromyxobacter sp. K]|uniref:TatD family hydrolase n=1 Tax=Anaeromyxobacter sp. (strain K) TaxID=447217 RepID=UPI00017BE3ED|nr:TatD family hydrolase [Anaeromyxobacter sp. K]ACG75268.1 TatD-related deoxyribonuclease [Anaeromyxobacter sp. K]